FAALIVLLQHHIDDARDRVGSIDRGGTVLQHLDALYRVDRNGVQGNESCVLPEAKMPRRSWCWLSRSSRLGVQPGGDPTAWQCQQRARVERKVPLRADNGFSPTFPCQTEGVTSGVMRGRERSRQRVRGKLAPGV